ncbi:hypothetical protein AUR64_18690 [Haloprofundus marisrubri]|uniref:Uncharacterized protein n=1 Tax=Haloprofundus marisrubri TaxID=1514971 RepID=A0A0W1R5U4_9EURY|nr:hypothetical protein AUR64_18690 [Haloprofundus marisrubri]
MLYFDCYSIQIYTIVDIAGDSAVSATALHDLRYGVFRLAASLTGVVSGAFVGDTAGAVGSIDSRRFGV